MRAEVIDIPGPQGSCAETVDIEIGASPGLDARKTDLESASRAAFTEVASCCFNPPEFRDEFADVPDTPLDITLDITVMAEIPTLSGREVTDSRVVFKG